MINVSDFIDSSYKEYAHYTISSRAIPSIRDGLKPVQRRILWTAKQSAQDFTKVSNLAGVCLKIHPHGDAALSSAISNMAQDFCGANNYPLLEGKGGFGGRITGPGNGVAAPRYVSVKVNKFSKDVIYKDFDLVNEIPNYDGEYTEAEYFIPIIPTILLNGISGIAVGFACEFQPYNIKDIIQAQKEVLEKKIITKTLTPYFKGFNGKVYWDEIISKFKTEGTFKKETDLLRITELPIGYTHEYYIKILDSLLEEGKIKDYYSDSTKEFSFRIYFSSKKTLSELSDSEIITTFKLTSTLSQNLTVLDINNKLKVYSNIMEIIKDFTEWRFTFYKKRYEKYRNDLAIENDRKKELIKFIIFVLKNDYLNKMSKQSAAETKADLIKEQFNDVDYLINIGVTNFSKDKIITLKEHIDENTKKLKEHQEIIESEEKQKEIYIQELEALQNNN